MSLGSISEDATNSGSKISIPLQVPESSKKQNLNFLGTGKYIDLMLYSHSIYIVLGASLTADAGCGLRNDACSFKPPRFGVIGSTGIGDSITSLLGQVEHLKAKPRSDLPSDA